MSKNLITRMTVTALIGVMVTGCATTETGTSDVLGLGVTSDPLGMNVSLPPREARELVNDPIRIRVEAQFLAFKLEDIKEALAREGSVGVDALLLLRREGKFRLLEAPQVTATSGYEATVKVVTEHVYPTEFELVPADGSDDASSVAGYVAEPGQFETREVGIFLTVCPELSPDEETICLTLSPELVLEPETKMYEMKTPAGEALPLEHPFFFTHSVSSQLAVADGGTAILGGGCKLRGGAEVLYVLVTANKHKVGESGE